MLCNSFGRHLCVCGAAAVLLVSGCRSSQQPLTSPLAADRVPAPATRLIQPGTAQPYYPGDALPATGQMVAPPQAFAAQPAPAFGQAPAVSTPQAFGQAQPPVVQAQPFNPQPQAFTQPQTQPYSQPQTFGQPPALAPGTTLPPATPAVNPQPPFSPAPPPAQPFPSTSGAATTPGVFNAAASRPPRMFIEDGAAIAIPADDQAVRPVVSEQPLAAPARFMQPVTASPVSNQVAVRMTPLSPPASSVTKSASPEFDALPAATNLPWVSGTAPRQQAVVPAARLAPIPDAAPAPRVRLPAAGRDTID